MFKRLFKKPFDITLNRVHEAMRISEGGEAKTFYVDADATRLAVALKQAGANLQKMNKDTTEDEARGAALAFAAAIFGDDQASELMAFYRDDPTCVINVCGQFFRGCLMRAIEKAQRHVK